MYPVDPVPKKTQGLTRSIPMTFKVTPKSCTGSLPEPRATRPKKISRNPAGFRQDFSNIEKLIVVNSEMIFGDAMYRVFQVY